QENSSESWTFYRVLLDERGNIVGPLGGLTGLRLVHKLEDLTYSCREITDFNDLPIPFAAVATDLVSGEAVIIREGSLPEAMRASMSIPALFQPWKKDGRLLVDGGLVANLPVRIARDIFPGFPVIAVDITASSKREDQINTTIDVIDQCINIMTGKDLREDLAAADLVIRPDVGDLPILDTNLMEEALEAGTREAERSREQIRDLAERSKRLPRPMASEKGSFQGDLLEDRDPFPSPFYSDRRIVRDFRYEALLGGYYSTFHDHNWLYGDVIMRDLLEEEDTLSLQLIAGEEWGLGLRYLNEGDAWENRTDTRILFRKRVFEPRNSTDVQWDRYALSFSERFYLGSLRGGIGLLGEYYHFDKEWKGHYAPTLFLSYDSMDDMIDPTEGTSITAEFTYLDLEELIARMEFSNVHSFRNNGYRLMMKGGFSLGDEHKPYYRAYLGGREELLSLAEHPLSGENSAWWQILLRKVMIQNWWGTINADLFYTRGYLLDHSLDILDDPWEAGFALSVPGSVFNGKIIAVYGEEEDWSFGLTLGIPLREGGAHP
ncbi:MAG: patatin-like phospholipase family protein, partial [Synergistales bacterium]|nr:patatin-like phospholipase family protein [Synergistales bacterium]